MKKLTIILGLAAACMLFSVRAAGQNLQLHYDPVRNCATTTVEMFRPDAVGNTFFFVDIDHNPKVSGAYWEISREFNFWADSKLDWLSVHIEYNGGLTTGLSYNNCWLGGLTYAGHSDDWSKTWLISAMYKAIPGTIGLNGRPQVHNFQITGVWNLDFFDHWLSFDGFVDIWREVRMIVISEPQLWVNLNKIKGWEKINLSVGTEVELSYNFIGKGFHALPTIGAKWTF